MKIPTISGDGLALRRMSAADAPAILGVWGDLEVMRFMARPPLADLADARAFIADIDALAEREELLQWGIQLDGETAIVGTVTLVLSDRRHETADIGFAVDRSRWGEGIVSRAARPIVDYAFETLGVHRLQADCDPRNPGSLRVLEKLGFQREGVMRSRYLQLGERQDAVLLSLLRSEA